jgi:hypothetical protein
MSSGTCCHHRGTLSQLGIFTLVTVTSPPAEPAAFKAHGRAGHLIGTEA